MLVCLSLSWHKLREFDRIPLQGFMQRFLNFGHWAGAATFFVWWVASSLSAERRAKHTLSWFLDTLLFVTLVVTLTFYSAKETWYNGLNDWQVGERSPRPPPPQLPDVRFRPSGLIRGNLPRIGVNRRT